jgi:hypothetical protein
MSVYSLLNKVQTELVAPKNQFNAFGKYNYRSCEDILEGVKSLLKEVNCVIVISDSIEMVGDRIYIKATAKFVDCETGEAVESTALAREELSKAGMALPQVTGSSSSYARKYALNGLLLVDDSKDADSMDNSKEEAPQQQQDNDDKPWLNAGAELNSLIARAKQDGLTGDETLKLGRTKYKINKKLSEEIKEALK